MNRVLLTGLSISRSNSGAQSLPKLMRRNNHLDIWLIRNCIWECWTKSGSGTSRCRRRYLPDCSAQSEPVVLKMSTAAAEVYELSFRLIVRRFFRDQHIVDVRFAQARR